jgi:hypothetical protein
LRLARGRARGIELGAKRVRVLVAFAERSRHVMGFAVARRAERLAGRRFVRAVRGWQAGWGACGWWRAYREGGPRLAGGVSGVRNRCWEAGCLRSCWWWWDSRRGSAARGRTEPRLASGVRAVVRVVVGFAAGECCTRAYGTAAGGWQAGCGRSCGWWQDSRQGSAARGRFAAGGVRVVGQGFGRGRRAGVAATGVRDSWSVSYGGQAEQRVFRAGRGSLQSVLNS